LKIVFVPTIKFGPLANPSPEAIVKSVESVQLVLSKVQLPTIPEKYSCPGEDAVEKSTSPNTGPLPK
jgi:hypothetical protein